MAKSPLYYKDMYLGDVPLSAVFWGRDRIWRVPYPQIRRRMPIMVYAPETRDFLRNGMAALSPSSAVHELTFGQAGEITVIHPVDRQGRWRSLLPNRILLVPLTWHGVPKPQAFRIYRIVKQMDNAGKKTITAYARHVFYDLNYSLLDDMHLYLTPSGTLTYLFRNQTGAQGEPYFYHLASDAWFDREDATIRNYSISPASVRRDTTFQDTNIANALIGGSGSIAQTWGLELYVDNFYFSLLRVMEASMQNSFAIRYGYDMTNVTEDIDYTNAYTHLFCYDNFGNMSGSSMQEEAWGPYVRPKKAKFSYNYAYPDAADNLSRLTQDKETYWQSSNSPSVAYSAQYAPLQADNRREFLGQLDGREVGDTGTVTNTDLGISTTQRIVYKKTDLLTGITLGIKLGNAPSYLTQPGRWGETVRTGSPSAIEKQVEALASSASGTT